MVLNDVMVGIFRWPHLKRTHILQRHGCVLQLLLPQWINPRFVASAPDRVRCSGQFHATMALKLSLSADLPQSIYEA